IEPRVGAGKITLRSARDGTNLVLTAAGRQAGAVVGDSEDEIRAVACGAERDFSGADARLDAVADRVFHDRLQDEARHLRVERGRVDVGLHGEAIAKTDS